MTLKYNLGGLMFSSKQAVAKHAKKIKDTTPIDTTLTGQDFNFMFDLLRWHPDSPNKIGAGVRSIQIRANPTFKHPEFYLWRTDGTGTEFSYRQCTSPTSPIGDFNAACRVAVVDDIIAFRDKALANFPRCPITGDALDKLNSHVDHEPPLTFARLVVDWSRIEKIDGRKVVVTGRHVDNQYRLELADIALRARWILYHRANANLRLVSKTANLRIIGNEWEVMLNYLRTTAHKDVLVEWKGKRQFFTRPEFLTNGIFMMAQRAPEETPVIDGAIILIEASLADEKRGAA